MIYRGKDSLVEALKSGALASIDIDTSVYKKAHGKEPHGRGAWIFSSKPGVDPKKEEEGKDYLLAVTDSYDAAVKKAKQWAKEQKKSKIYLMENTHPDEEDVSKIILQQLGGNKFIVMTGAKNFVRGKNSLTFNIGRNKTSANKIKITLNSKDLYDVEFFKGGKSMKTFDDIYFDGLRKIFTDYTGMRTSLYEETFSSTAIVEALKPKKPEWMKKLEGK